MTLQSLLHLQSNGDGVLNRRAFLSRYAGAIGTLALSALLEQDRAQGREQLGGEAPQARPETGVTRKARARSVICLFQHGGPSQMDLFDPKPALACSCSSRQDTASVPIAPA